MTTNEFLIQVNDNWRGNDDVAPVIGTDDANYWLRLANRIRRTLYSDTSKQWTGAYQVLNLGPITVSGALSFPLPAGFLDVAEGCYSLDANNARRYFNIIKPQEQTAQQAVFVAGMNPQTLYFSKAITAQDNFVGATLYLPAYVIPADIAGVTGNEVVVVDDVDWLAMATAAELAFNDITYESKAPDLNAKANDLYKKMLNVNRRGTPTHPRKSRYNVTRIGQRHSTRSA